jgi:hypothetical protein
MTLVATVVTLKAFGMLANKCLHAEYEAISIMLRCQNVATQYALIPPSATMVCPFIKRDSSDDKNSTI